MYSCIRCGACCKNHILLVSFHDLREMHSHYPQINLKDKIAIFQLGKDYEHDEHLKYIQPLLFNISGWPRKGYLGIQFIPNGKETLCPFLDLPSNNCQIYDHRPLLCRKYPYGINETGEFLIQQVRCPGRTPLNSNEIEEVCDFINFVWTIFRDFSTEIDYWNRNYQTKSKNEFFQMIWKN